MFVMWSSLLLMHIKICCSESVAMENKVLIVGTSNDMSSSTQPSGFQSAWVGVPGHVSMADIVKMGRPHGKASTVANPSIHSGSHHNVLTTSAATHHNLHPLQDHAANVTDINAEPGVATNQHLPSDDDWPAIEQQPAAILSSVVEAPSDSDSYADPSNLSLDRGNQHTKSQLDEVRVADDLAVEMLNANHVGPTSVSSRNMQEDSSGGASVFDNSMYEDMDSYQPHNHDLEHSEGDYNNINIALHCTSSSLIIFH
jgi:hypothetical protein